MFWFECSWFTNFLGCVLVYNKLLLITNTSVIHWFYFCYFWTFGITWHQKWDPQSSSDSKVSDKQTGGGNPQTPLTSLLSRQYWSVRLSLSLIQAPLFLCFELSDLLRIPVFCLLKLLGKSSYSISKGEKHMIPCVLDQLGNKAFCNKDIFGHLKAKISSTWSMDQNLCLLENGWTFEIVVATLKNL